MCDEIRKEIVRQIKMCRLRLFLIIVSLCLVITFLDIATGQSPYEEEEDVNFPIQYMFGFYICMGLCCIFQLISVLLSYWVYKDALLRGKIGILWACFTFFTLQIGLIIYLIVRWRQTKKNWKDEKTDQQSRHYQPYKTDHIWTDSLDPKHDQAISYANQNQPQHRHIDYSLMSRKELVVECNERDIQINWWTSDKKILIELLEDDDKKRNTEERRGVTKDRAILLMENEKNAVHEGKTCPKCNGTIPITSPERPLKVTCPDCNASFSLKGKPTAVPKPVSAQIPTPIAPASKQDFIYEAKTCPKCKSKIPIMSEERPLKVTCPGCSASYTLKEKGKKEMV